eukprot:1963611-Alexandrium_andersonii.AAC.1
MGCEAVRSQTVSPAVSTGLAAAIWRKARQHPATRSFMLSSSSAAMARSLLRRPSSLKIWRSDEG